MLEMEDLSALGIKLGHLVTLDIILKIIIINK